MTDIESDKRPDLPPNGSTRPPTPEPTPEEIPSPLGDLDREDIPHPTKVGAAQPLFTEEEQALAAEPASVQLSGPELMWLSRKIEGAETRSKEIVKNLSGKAKHELTAAQAEELRVAREFGQVLTDNSQKLGTLVEASLKRRQALRARKFELEDVLRFTDEADAKAEATRELLELPDEEESLVATISMDRPSVKFVLSVVEAEIDRIRRQVIPHYEKVPDEAFEGSHPRSYYVNKNEHMKIVLELLAKKLEKRL